jgi:hypothetical protein
MQKNLKHILAFVLIFILSISWTFGQSGSDTMQLMNFTGSSGKIKKVENSCDFEKWRLQIPDNMQFVVGLMPDVSKKTSLDIFVIDKTCCSLIILLISLIKPGLDIS